MYRRRKALAAVAAVIASLAFASSASANTIQVTTSADDIFNATPTTCSLREAIVVADNDISNPTNGCTGASGTDTITFDPSVTTINLTPDLAHGGDNNHGELIIFSTLNISGPGMNDLIINAPTGGRIFRITSGAAQVNISGLTVQNGSPSEDDESLGGGIRSDAPLALTDVKVADNTATATTDVNADTRASGGGVYAGDNFTLTDSVVSGNTADAENPAVIDGEAQSSGGGVLSGGITQIIDSTIAGNTASATDEHDDGGGPGNAARTFAGGLATGPLSVTITGSTISNNTSAPTSLEGPAYAWGGGIKLGGGATTIERSTIALNRTDPVGDTFASGEGGGIIGFGGTLSLKSSTVATNGANTGSSETANLAVDFAGLATTAKNTIIGYPLGASSTNCDAAITSSGFNIDSGTSCGLDPGTTPSDQEGITPALGSLLDNGGPTETMLPQVGSPAIDKGSSVGQTDTTEDQRGLTRPVNSATVTNVAGGDGSDIGAVEAQAPPAPTVTGTIPPSPQTNDVSPEVVGTTTNGPSSGESPSSVTIFGDAGCATAVSSTPGGSPTDFTTGITALLPPNTTTTLYANTSNDYGIKSPCSSSFVTYKLDSLGPVITIDPGPSDQTDHTPTFTFHTSDPSPPIAYECSVDGAAFSACDSPFTTASLGNGSHTFRVQGTDSIGNGGAPATRAFTISTPPPGTTPPSTTPPSVTPPATKKKKCKKAKKRSASAAKKCKKHKK
jgi:CSLREA domain-containing protein